MPKKIGRDVTDRKASAIISSPKDSEEFQKFLEEQEQEKKAHVELKAKMPTNEGEPTDEQLIKEREEEMAEFARWKARKLKPLEDGVEEV